MAYPPDWQSIEQGMLGNTAVEVTLYEEATDINHGRILETIATVTAHTVLDTTGKGLINQFEVASEAAGIGVRVWVDGENINWGSVVGGAVASSPTLTNTALNTGCGGENEYFKTGLFDAVGSNYFIYLIKSIEFNTSIKLQIYNGEAGDEDVAGAYSYRIR